MAGSETVRRVLAAAAGALALWAPAAGAQVPAQAEPPRWRISLGAGAGAAYGKS